MRVMYFFSESQNIEKFIFNTIVPPFLLFSNLLSFTSELQTDQIGAKTLLLREQAKLFPTSRILMMRDKHMKHRFFSFSMTPPIVP